MSSTLQTLFEFFNIAGTFLAWERLTALYQFVRDSLENDWQPFELMAPGGQKLKDDEETPINECNLVGPNLGADSFSHSC